MNAAWGGIDDTHQLNMCVSHTHKTVENLLKTRAFTVSMGTAEQAVTCDYVGMSSANNSDDKMARTGWHATRSELVNAPLFDELPMALECELLSYDPESGHLKAKIVNVSADESILDAQGKIDPAKLRPITLDPINNAYLELGGKVGNAFKDGLQLKG